jgi:Fe-S-cluster-containing hydrogenase component 2
MAVLITDICINCDACLDECPTESIVDNDDNPTGEDIYFVNSETCDECTAEGQEPACAEACPTEGCIVWGENPTTDGAVAGEPCVEE